jgi:hypothetical protein
MHQRHYWGNPWYNHWGKRYVGISQDLSTLKDVNGFDLMSNSDSKDNSSPRTVICMCCNPVTLIVNFEDGKLNSKAINNL